MRDEKQKLFVIFQVGLVFCLLFLFPKIVWAVSLDVEKIIALTNLERIKNNLLPLSVNQKLNQAAEDKINDMIEKNYFAHNNPEGLEPWYWIENENYNYQYAGENLALDFENENELIQAWMSSKTHRENILNSNFKEIGLAVKEGNINSKNSIAVVQFFGQEYLEEKNNEIVKIVHIPEQTRDNTMKNEQEVVLTSDITDNKQSVLSWKNTEKKENSSITTLSLLNVYIIPTFTYLEKGKNSNIPINDNKKPFPNMVLILTLINCLTVSLYLLFLHKIYKKQILEGSRNPSNY